MTAPGTRPSSTTRRREAGAAPSRGRVPAVWTEFLQGALCALAKHTEPGRGGQAPVMLGIALGVQEDETQHRPILGIFGQPRRNVLSKEQ